MANNWRIDISIHTQLIASLLAGWLLVNAALAQPTPQITPKLLPSVAEYRLKGSGMSAKAERRIEPLGGTQWKASLDASLWFFSLQEETRFQLVDGNVRPDTYVLTRTGSRKNQKVSFDWNRGLAVNGVKSDVWDSEIQNGDHSKLSFQLQLQVDLLNGRIEESKSYAIVDRGRSKVYLIEKIGEETVQLQSGLTLRTIKLRQSREGGDRETLFWLAADHNYLLVKLAFKEDDDEGSLELLSGSIAGTPIR